MKHFLTIDDASGDDLHHILDVAFRLREQRPHGNDSVLRGQSLAMIFEKPSLRTRVSFEQAMVELGGHAIVLNQQGVGLGVRESVADVTRVLDGMVHGIAARVFEHAKLVEMADHASVPVINMLSDDAHPCQALADIMTLMDEFAPESRDLTGRTVAWIGDGNNVARSLALICGKLGINFVIAAPGGYELGQSFIDHAMSVSPGMNLIEAEHPGDAVHDADAIFTDTWVSMGQETEKDKRQQVFAEYQVSEQLLAKAPKHAVVLHCLPAYRGSEITARVIDGPQSRVFPEAHNRLHAQKGLLAVLMGGV